jgi:hypothetical protein
VVDGGSSVVQRRVGAVQGRVQQLLQDKQAPLQMTTRTAASLMYMRLGWLFDGGRFGKVLGNVEGLGWGSGHDSPCPGRAAGPSGHGAVFVFLVVRLRCSLTAAATGFLDEAEEWVRTAMVKEQEWSKEGDQRGSKTSPTLLVLAR